MEVLLRHKETISHGILCHGISYVMTIVATLECCPQYLLWIVAMSYKGLKARNLFQLIFPLTWPLVAGCAGRPDVVESRGSSPPDSWYQHPAHTPAPGGGGGVLWCYNSRLPNTDGSPARNDQDNIPRFYCYGNHNIMYSTPTMQGWLHSAEQLSFWVSVLNTKSYTVLNTESFVVLNTY